MQLSASTKLNDLLSTHPFLEDVLVAYNPHFQMLRNKVARATVGRLATLGAAARIAGVDLVALLGDLATAIEKQTSTRPEVSESARPAEREQRIAMLGHITVQNCHPPKSVDTVNRILESFRQDTKDVAEFWIEMGGRFIHIRYFAVRDDARNYRGCLEVTQDIAPIRALEGQRRLLDWKD